MKDESGKKKEAVKHGLLFSSSSRFFSCFTLLLVLNWRYLATMKEEILGERERERAGPSSRHKRTTGSFVRSLVADQRLHKKKKRHRTHKRTSWEPTTTTTTTTKKKKKQKQETKKNKKWERRRRMAMSAGDDLRLLLLLPLSVSGQLAVATS